LFCVAFGRKNSAEEKANSMSSEQNVTVKVSRRYDASPERVFDAWLDPAKAGKWLFATATGEMIRVVIDPRVEGKFIFVDRRDGVDVEHVGEYLEVDRPRRLAFNFAVPMFSSLYTKVIIDIAPSGTGCELTLTHEGALPDFAGQTEKGWGMLLDGLAATVT
jgi:uncharacterized protein YndB with AHSA1/START domain